MAVSNEVIISIRGKNFKVSAGELPKLHKSVGATWNKTIRNYEAHMKAVHGIWKTQYDLREEYFFTSHILQAVTSAYFPTQADLQVADDAIKSLKAAAGAGKLEGIQNANHEAEKWVGRLSKEMDNYTKAISSSATNLVAGAEFTRDAAKDGVEILSQLILAKAPGGAAAAAAVSGGYNELLDQIEKAQAPNAPNIMVAAAIVINAAAMDALIKGSMTHFKLAEKVYEKVGGQATKLVGKYMKPPEISDYVKKIWEKQIETTIESSLKEIVKAFKPGSKLTLAQALENIFDEVLKKTTAMQVFGKIPNQIAKTEGLVLAKIKSGAIKGVKLEGKALEEQVKKLVENSIEKLLEKVIKGTGEKVDNLAQALMAEIINDSKFKADVTKIAAKQK